MKFFISIVLAVIFALMVFMYGPVLKENIKYGFDRTGNIRYIVEKEPLNSFERRLDPVNTEFSIIIPKIAAVASISEDIDPSQKRFYLSALAEGLAHAQGTAKPGQIGNVYLFAHAEDAFWHVNTYNAVFYLMNKLERKDEIYVYYKDRRYKYSVDYKKIVDPFEVKYEGTLEDEGKTLTLQTDYPAGTTFKRLIIVAYQTED